jgi:hypothetical protein
MARYNITSFSMPEYTPEVGMDVTADALRDLISNPEVKSIQTDYEWLLAKARKNGTVMVIVILHLDPVEGFPPSPNLPVEEQEKIDQAQREAAAKVQDRLLASTSFQ